MNFPSIIQNIPLLVAAVCTITTINRLLSAYEDRRVYRDARRLKIANDRLHEFIADAGVRREWLRLIKHTVLVVTIYLVADLYAVPFVVAVLLSFEALLLALNSVADYELQRKAIEELKRTP